MCEHGFEPNNEDAPNESTISRQSVRTFNAGAQIHAIGAHKVSRVRHFATSKDAHGTVAVAHLLSHHKIPVPKLDIFWSRGFGLLCKDDARKCHGNQLGSSCGHRFSLALAQVAAEFTPPTRQTL